MRLCVVSSWFNMTSTLSDWSGGKRISGDLIDRHADILIGDSATSKQRGGLWKRRRAG
jgi:hypothetical protein